MKEILFPADLCKLFRHDAYYTVPGNLLNAMERLGGKFANTADNDESRLRALAIHILELGGESEPFLAEKFIHPDDLAQLLDKNKLPRPASLQQAASVRADSNESIDPARFEQLFDIVCRNCGTVSDPLASSYRTPIGRLVFRTFLGIRQTLGITTTAQYVLGHLKDFDTEQIVISIDQDAVTWGTGDTTHRTTLDKIAGFIVCFNRELDSLL